VVMSVYFAGSDHHHHHHHHHHGHGFEFTLDHVFALISLTAVFFVTRHTHFRAVKVLLWVFYVVFSAAIVLTSAVDARFEYLGYAASAGLIITHLFNIRACRIRGHAHPH
jgi:hypothetical protein